MATAIPDRGGLVASAARPIAACGSGYEVGV